MEYNTSLWAVTEDEEVFRGIELHGIHKNCMLIETCSDTDDGTFPRLSDFNRMSNRIDKYGASEYLTWISGRVKRSVIDIDYCIIKRESKYCNKAILSFKKPIKVLIGEIGDEPIIKEVSEIKGEFTYDFFWTKDGKNEDRANGFEIWFSCEKYLK